MGDKTLHGLVGISWQITCRRMVLYMIAKFGSRSKCGDENFMKKMLDEAINFAYNKNSALKWMFTTFRMYWVSIKEVYYSHENDISAEGKTAQERTRL
jgi:hypothetical protein